MAGLTFDCITTDGVSRRTFRPEALVLAGWTGRDPGIVQAHIEELAAHGVAAPSQTPVYYRCSASLVTQTRRLEVLGPDTSGEIEFVLLAFDDGIWITVGSDQTDRKAEGIVGVAMSKQLAGKVLANACWPFDEVRKHWDRLHLSATIVAGGEAQTYQDADLDMILAPETLIAGATQALGAKDGLALGTVVMSGTPPAIGGVRPAERFDMALHDPVLGRTIAAGFEIRALPVVS